MARRAMRSPPRVRPTTAPAPPLIPTAPAPPLIPRVRFPQNSVIAKCDVWLSALIAAAPLGPFEHLVFLPAHFFGAPLCSLCILPSALALLVAPTGGWTLFLAAAAIAGLLPLLLCALGHCSPDVFHKGTHVAAAAACALAGTRLTGERAFQAACLYLASWLTTTALVWMLKGYAGRLRPAAALAGGTHARAQTPD